MDIEEIRKLKEQGERAIGDILIALHNKTGVSFDVHGELVFLETTTGGELTKTINVKLTGEI